MIYQYFVSYLDQIIANHGNTKANGKGSITLINHLDKTNYNDQR